MTTTTTNGRGALGRALFAATLAERLKALPAVKRRALANAIARTRIDSPTDRVLVEFAGFLAAAETPLIDA